jgi:hypothetical protein
MDHYNGPEDDQEDTDHRFCMAVDIPATNFFQITAEDGKR